MSDIVKSPNQCVDSEIELFFDLLMKGKEVEKRTARNGIKRAKYLAFHYEGNALVGIAAIKHPTESYKLRIFGNAKTIGLSDIYAFELGYIFTDEMYRRRGICSNLIDQLLEKFPVNLYATTKTTNLTMETALEHRGFRKMGRPYEGKLSHTKEKYHLQLFVRDI